VVHANPLAYLGYEVSGGTLRLKEYAAEGKWNRRSARREGLYPEFAAGQSPSLTLSRPWSAMATSSIAAKGRAGL
jgi:hypothetical protein